MLAMFALVKLLQGSLSFRVLWILENEMEKNMENQMVTKPI